MFLLGSLVLYNAVNIYTDIRWLKTKNLWHLFFWLFWVIDSFVISKPSFTEALSFMFFGCILWLLFGLYLESQRFFAPGDTKMVVTNAMGLTAICLQMNVDVIFHLFLFNVTYIFMLFLVGCYNVIKSRGIKGLYYLFVYRIATQSKAKKFAGATIIAPSSLLVAIYIYFL